LIFVVVAASGVLKWSHAHSGEYSGCFNSGLQSAVQTLLFEVRPTVMVKPTYMAKGGLMVLIHCFDIHVF